MGFVSLPSAVQCVGWQEDCGLRAEMEDGHCFVDDFLGSGMAFFAIYDGHGGTEAMEYCVDFLHQNLYVELEKHVSTSASSSPLRGPILSCGEKTVVDALVRSFKKTDINLMSVGIQSGATACCCLLVNIDKFK